MINGSEKLKNVHLSAVNLELFCFDGGNILTIPSPSKHNPGLRYEHYRIVTAGNKCLPTYSSL